MAECSLSVTNSFFSACQKTLLTKNSTESVIQIEFGFYFEFPKVKRYQFLERKYFTADNCVMLCNLS